MEILEYNDAVFPSDFTQVFHQNDIMVSCIHGLKQIHVRGILQGLKQAGVTLETCLKFSGQVQFFKSPFQLLLTILITFDFYSYFIQFSQLVSTLSYSSR